MRWAWVWLAMGCASQKSAESHADYVAEVQTTRTEGAERVTVVEEVYGAPQETQAEAPAGGMPNVQAVEGQPPQGPRATEGRQVRSAGQGERGEAPPAGLIRRTTTTIDRAPIITETHAGTDLHTDAESASSRTWFHLGFLAWAGIAAGAVAAALLAWRFRTGLASGVLRVLGRG